MVNTALIAFLIATGVADAEVVDLHARDTLTALEMDPGDQLRFRLRDGRLFNLVLEDTEAAIVEKVNPGGIVYSFSARVRVDGQPVTLKRYVCCQECFYEPYVINGVWIWLDTVKDVFDLIPIRYPRQGNLQCMPRKSVRLAIQDATLRICPQEMHPWIEDERNFLDVSACYNGDDCYLGPYLGQACHVGMDINHPKGNLLFAPIDFDTQAYFNSLAMGHNNNRWRGIRRWENGDVWALQTHHLIELLVPENTPLMSRSKYATTAGVHVGSHQHTHFEFKIGRAREILDGDSQLHQPGSIAVPIDFDDESPRAQEQPEVLHLDPWIVFRQIFEDRRSRRKETRAMMKPLGPARTGQSVTFSAEGSRPGPGGNKLGYFWTFGDGGSARGPRPIHLFARSGVYPVTLVVDDGVHRDSTTQHVTINGEPVQEPLLALSAPGEPTFCLRPVHAVDVYGQAIPFIPHALRFLARSSRSAPDVKVIHLANMGTGDLPEAGVPKIEPQSAAAWLEVACQGQDNRQSFKVAVDATGLAPGKYTASVEVACTGALNSPQAFRVELQVDGHPLQRDVTVDDRDPGFHATPYFWVGQAVSLFRFAVRRRPLTVSGAE